MALGADADQNLSIVVRLRDEASKALETLQGKIKTMQSEMAGNAVDASTKFAMGLTAVGLGMGAIIGKGIQVQGDLESARMGFVTLLGSADAADKTMTKIKLAASNTPFEIVGLTKATQMLSSVTKDGDKALKAVLDIGEGIVAMGGGQAEMDRIVVNMQQIASLGHANALDIKQFAFAKIPIYDMLEKQTGLAGEKLATFISSGGVTFDLLTEMFDKANDSGGRFFGAYINQAGTYNQLMSNMSDVTNIFLADLVKSTGIFDAVKRALSAIIQFLGDHREGIFQGIQKGIQWFKDNGPMIAGIIIGGLTPAILALVAAFVTLAASLAPFMALGAGIGLLIQGLRDGDPILSGIGATIVAIVIPAVLSLSGTILASVIPAIGALVIAFAPFLIGGLLIGGLVAGIVWLVKNWDDVKTKATEIWGGIATYLSTTWETIKGDFSTYWNDISTFVDKVWEDIKKIIKLAVDVAAGFVVIAFKALGVDIIPIWDGIKKTVQDTWDAMKKIVSDALDALATLWKDGWKVISDALTPVWQGIEKSVQDGWDWIKNKFTEFKQPVLDIWNSLWNSLGGVVTDAWDNAKSIVVRSINGIIEKINSVISSINGVASAGGSLTGISAPQIPSIPKLATGTNYVPNDTLAFLHKGEAVVPAKYNPSAGGNGGGVYITINNPVVRDQRDLDQLKSQMGDIFRSLNINRKLSMS